MTELIIFAVYTLIGVFILSSVSGKQKVHVLEAVAMLYLWPVFVVWGLVSRMEK